LDLDGESFWGLDLVIRAISEDLAVGDTIPMLQQMMYELPPDVEGIYDKMLEKMLSSRYASQAVPLIDCVMERKEVLNLLKLSFAEEGVDAVLRQRRKPVTGAEREARCKGLQKRLRSRCSGFLEVIRLEECLDEGGKETYHFHIVQFIHQTVQTYLKGEQVQLRLEPKRDRLETVKVRLIAADIGVLNSYDPALEQSSFLEMLKRYLGDGPGPNSSFQDIVQSCISNRDHKAHFIDPSHRKLLDQLGRILSIKELVSGRRSSYKIGQEAWPGEWQTNYLSFAVYSQWTGYVRSVIEKDKPALEKLGRPYLHYAVAGCEFIGQPPFPDINDMGQLITTLLDNGADINRRYCNRTAWQIMMAWMAFDYYQYHNTQSSSDGSNYAREGGSHKLHHGLEYFQILKLLIERGTNTNDPVPKVDDEDFGGPEWGSTRQVLQ